MKPQPTTRQDHAHGSFKVSDSSDPRCVVQNFLNEHQKLDNIGASNSSHHEPSTSVECCCCFLIGNCHRRIQGSVVVIRFNLSHPLPGFVLTAISTKHFHERPEFIDVNNVLSANPDHDKLVFCSQGFDGYGGCVAGTGRLEWPLSIQPYWRPRRPSARDICDA